MDKSPAYTGLTAAAVVARQTSDGFNELPSQKPKSLFGSLIALFKEPMLLLLLISGLLYLLLGELTDALLLLGGIIIVVGISLYQERKTEAALTALKQLSSPRALVIRDGQKFKIPGREVVVGDLVIVAEGDRIPADGLVVHTLNISVDESLLTGESLPVDKTASLANKTNQVYGGSLVVSGRATIQITSIGVHTQMGKIGHALETIVDHPTLLKQETDRIIKIFALIGFSVCLLVAVIYGISEGNLLRGVLAGLTLGMSVLPEEFTVVLVVFLTLGAWRMSKHHVLTREISAIETLGTATALCVDKTGTITQNRMALDRLVVGQSELVLSALTQTDLTPEFNQLLTYAALSSHRDPFDPMEKAIQENRQKYLPQFSAVFPAWTLIKEYPLTTDLLCYTRVWQVPDQTELVVATKGAPEAIAVLCRFSPRQTADLLAHIKQLSDSGLRVLGVAKCSASADHLPVHLGGLHFTFQGLLGFADPIRPGIADSVSRCYHAGIKIYMITGDYPGTAIHIASQIGLTNPTQVITGAELAALDLAHVRQAVSDTFIFARVAPAQKLQIVEALKANHEIVAMTGDGVNDAPALKAAQIGIAMGERGTDVAREAADLVLLDDDFSSIVTAVKIGRRIYDNLKKAMGYIIAVHIPIIGLALLPLLLGFPLILMPAQIALLELIIDPACSVVFEAEHSESDTLLRPPRPQNTALFDRRLLVISAIQGLGVLVCVSLVFLITRHFGLSEAAIRTLTFMTLISGNLMLIATNLTWKKTVLSTIITTKNHTLWWLMLAAAILIPLFVYHPTLSNLLHFSPVPVVYLIGSILAGIFSLFWFEGLKLFKRSSILTS